MARTYPLPTVASATTPGSGGVRAERGGLEFDVGIDLVLDGLARAADDERAP